MKWTTRSCEIRLTLAWTIIVRLIFDREGVNIALNKTAIRPTTHDTSTKRIIPSHSNRFGAHKCSILKQKSLLVKQGRIDQRDVILTPTICCMTFIKIFLWIWFNSKAVDDVPIDALFSIKCLVFSCYWAMAFDTNFWSVFVWRLPVRIKICHYFWSIQCFPTKLMHISFFFSLFEACTHIIGLIVRVKI